MKTFSFEGDEHQILPSTVHMKARWDLRGQTMEGFGVFAGKCVKWILGINSWLITN